MINRDEFASCADTGTPASGQESWEGYATCLVAMKLFSFTGEIEEFIHSTFRDVCLGFTLHTWLILGGRNANKMKKDVCFHLSGESRH